MKSENNTENTAGSDCQERLVRLLCDGRCAARHECQGEVKRVHVMLGSKDWGWFNYCAEARAEDRRNGYAVLFENIWCSQCGNDFGEGERGYSHCSDHAGRQCAGCKWAQEKEDRYDQMRCCCDDSPNAWGDVEATDSCSYFLPNVNEQTADKIGLSASPCSRLVRSLLFERSHSEEYPTTSLGGSEKEETALVFGSGLSKPQCRKRNTDYS